MYICSPPCGEAVKSLGEGIKLPVINGLGRTNRIDNWWSQPLTMGFALTLALLYTFWRLFLHDSGISYQLDGSTVMSPIFSPNVLEWELFGLADWDHPQWVNAAILVLWIPFGFRGTFSEAFRAPSVPDLYGGNSLGYPTADDACDDNTASGGQATASCQANGVPATGYVSNLVQIPTLYGGNPDLQPETSESWTIGAVIDPIDGLTTVSYTHLTLPTKA